MRHQPRQSLAAKVADVRRAVKRMEATAPQTKRVSDVMQVGSCHEHVSIAPQSQFLRDGPRSLRHRFGMRPSRREIPEVRSRVFPTHTLEPTRAQYGRT